MRPGRRSTDLGLRRTRPRGESGVSLLRSRIALGLAVILAVMALPTWRGWIARQELALRAQVLASALGRARTEAIRRGFRFNVCKSADRGHLREKAGRDWSRGWILHVDPESSGHPHPDEPPVAWDPPVAAPISIDGNGPVDDYVSFVPTGEARRLTGALQMGTFTLCRPGLPALQVVLAATGRVRVARTSATCPDAPRATACRRRLPSVRSVLPLVGLRLPVAAALPRVQGVDKGSRPCPPRTARTAPPPASRSSS